MRIHRRWRLRTGLLALCATLMTTTALHPQPTDTEWRHYGGDERSTRYSALDQISAENVAQLSVAWRWPFRNFGPAPLQTSPVTPLMVNGVLYFTAGVTRTVVAVDAGTGETLWLYRIREQGRGAMRPESNRGVSYWRDRNGRGRILVISAGYQLIALDADTGALISSFGNSGYVDLWRGLGRDGRVAPGTLGATAPPLVVGNVVVVGTSTRDTIQLPEPGKDYVPGYIRGYDARTGRLVWTFHTVPRPGEVGYDSWENRSADWMGETGAWAPFSADSELGYVYVPTEAPIGNYYGRHRGGDNLFANSIICLDAKTGRRVWHYQLIHHDLWDWDIPAAPILVDVTVGGRRVKAVVVLTKHAFAFVFDRVTGEPVWPIVERPVPASNVPGERAAPTQPHPTKPAAVDYQGYSEANLIDFTPALRARALTAIERYRLGPLFTPPIITGDSGKTATLQIPATGGAVGLEGGSVDPETGYLYVPSRSSASSVSLETDPADHSRVTAVRALGAGGSAVEGLGLPLFKPPFGRITAIDLKTGDHAWRVANGVPPRNIVDHPELKAAGIDTSNLGGFDRSPLLVTKTLLFAGGLQLRALDKASGRTVYRLDLAPSAVTGGLISYLHHGRQFIAFPVSGSNGAEMLAYALPPTAAAKPDR